jgi:hypothetical protein
VFSTKRQYDTWCKNDLLSFKEESFCDSAVKLCHKDNAKILLSADSRYKIEIDFTLSKISSECDVIAIEIEFHNQTGFIHSKKISHDSQQYYIHISEEFILRTLRSDEECFLVVKLKSPASIHTIDGKIMVREID